MRRGIFRFEPRSCAAFLSDYRRKVHGLFYFPRHTPQGGSRRLSAVDAASLGYEDTADLLRQHGASIYFSEMSRGTRKIETGLGT